MNEIGNAQAGEVVCIIMSEQKKARQLGVRIFKDSRKQSIKAKVLFSSADATQEFYETLEALDPFDTSNFFAPIEVSELPLADSELIILYDADTLSEKQQRAASEVAEKTKAPVVLIVQNEQESNAIKSFSKMKKRFVRL